MIIKALVASVVLAATVSSAAAYTGNPRFHPVPDRCILGEECVETCAPDQNGEDQCELFCWLELGPCGPDDGGGPDVCDETGDADNAPDECPDGGGRRP